MPPEIISYCDDLYSALDCRILKLYHVIGMLIHVIMVNVCIVVECNPRIRRELNRTMYQTFQCTRVRWITRHILLTEGEKLFGSKISRRRGGG